jgi:hypothetical protein
MAGDPEPAPEPNAPGFATTPFRYGIFVGLIALGFLAYGGMLLLPRLFESAAPTTDVPVMADPSPAFLPPPQPRCRHGAGACDWAGLQSPRPGCHNGVGMCYWGGLQSPQLRCHFGVGTCEWARKSPN